jgi:hypothetical protein
MRKIASMMEHLILNKTKSLKAETLTITARSGLFLKENQMKYMRMSIQLIMIILHFQLLLKIHTPLQMIPKASQCPEDIISLAQLLRTMRIFLK